MSSSKWWTALAVAFVAVSTAAGCNGDDGPPPDFAGEIECRGADCVCPGTGDCRIRCLDACNLQCAGSGGCDFVCSERCTTACTGSGPCRVSVGNASTVSCTGSGGCDVACGGDCKVDCPGSGECIARCEPGSACTIERCSGDVVDCPNGVRVCNGSCPS